MLIEPEVNEASGRALVALVERADSAGYLPPSAGGIPGVTDAAWADLLALDLVTIEVDSGDVPIVLRVTEAGMEVERVLRRFL
jgi:hypothetical protein